MGGTRSPEDDRIDPSRPGPAAGERPTGAPVTGDCVAIVGQIVLHRNCGYREGAPMAPAALQGAARADGQSRLGLAQAEAARRDPPPRLGVGAAALAAH